MPNNRDAPDNVAAIFMSIILDGKKVAEERSAELAQRVLAFSYVPKLVIVQVGDREESNIYNSGGIKDVFKAY